VASFPVVVGVTGSPSGVYPGATASLQIVYRQLSDVLLVPSLAINRTSGTTTVLVPNGGKQVRRTITTGLSSGGQTQVLRGLTEGEQVLVAVPTGTGAGGTNGRTGRQSRAPTVVLADLDEAVPSSSTTTRFGPRARAVTRPGG